MMLPLTRALGHGAEVGVHFAVESEFLGAGDVVHAAVLVHQTLEHLVRDALLQEHLKDLVRLRL